MYRHPIFLLIRKFPSLTTGQNAKLPPPSCELVVEDVEAGPCIKNQFLMSIFSPQLRVYHHFGTSTFNFHGFLNDFFGKALPSEYHIHPGKINMEPENKPSFKRKGSSSNHQFSGSMLIFGGCQLWPPEVVEFLASWLRRWLNWPRPRPQHLLPELPAHGVRHFFGGKATCLLRQLADLLVLQKLSNWVSVLSFW